MDLGQFPLGKLPPGKFPPMKLFPGKPTIPLPRNPTQKILTLNILYSHPFHYFGGIIKDYVSHLTLPTVHK